MGFIETLFDWDFSATIYELNCSKSRTTHKNNSATTLFESFETTTSDTLSTMEGTFQIGLMIIAIFGMIGLIILYTVVYRMCNSGKQPYHDSCKTATVHIALTLFTYALYLFDTLSDVFLFLHYYTIEQHFNFVLVMVFTFAPVLFIAFLFFAKHIEKFNCLYDKLSHQLLVCHLLLTYVLVFMFSPAAALLPTFTYAQELARGKSNSEFDTSGYLTSYLTLVEATLESAPQLTIQINLLITETHTDTTYTRTIRYLSIAASSLGLAWSLNAFKHQYRKTEQNLEDNVLVKFVHWISRFAEIFPRILLIALLAAEYTILVLFFIFYRLSVGIIYGTCEKRCDSKKFKFLEEPDLFLGMIGNIFCFCVSDVYKCHKKDQCGGKCFVSYYSVYYAENAILLYMWYSDNLALLPIKNGGTCSNHEWYAPYIFVIVILGFILQPSCLFLYYRLRRKQHILNSGNTLDKECDQTPSPDNISYISSEYNSYGGQNEHSLRRNQQDIVQDSTRCKQWNTHIDNHLHNHRFKGRRPANGIDEGQLGTHYGFRDGLSDCSQSLKSERSHQPDDHYPGERHTFFEDRQQLDYDHDQLGNDYDFRNGQSDYSQSQRYGRSHQTDQRFSGKRQNKYHDPLKPLDYDICKLDNNYDVKDGWQNYSHLQRFQRSNQTDLRYSDESQNYNQYRNQALDYDNRQLVNNYDLRDRWSNNSQLQRYDRSYVLDRRSTYLYGDECQNVGPIPHEDTTQLQHRGNTDSPRQWSNIPPTYMGWPAAAYDHKANFAYTFHIQSVEGNVGRGNSVGQYDSLEENAFSGY